MVFATLEDETGIANVVIWSAAFDRHRRVILSSRMMAVRGRLQIEGLVIHIVAESFTNMTDELVALAGGHSIGDTALAHGDEGNSDITPNYDLPRIRQGRNGRAQCPRRFAQGAQFQVRSLSISAARAASFSVTPPALCVVSVIDTLL